ncbi:Ankyrin-1 [Dactylella cylindrospora]|nr:Ankyrin-1 [Dactylella cylindrospora]
MEVAAGIVAFIQISNAVISYCWRFQSQVREAEKEIQDLVFEVDQMWTMATQIQEIVQPPGEPPRYSFENPEATEMLPKLQASIEKSQNILNGIQDKLGPMLRGGFRSKLRWPFETKSLQEKLEALQRQKSTFQLFLQIHQAKALEQQSLDIIEQKQNIEKVLSHSDRVKRTAVLNWYKTSDPEQNHKISREKHEPTTCNWVFDTKVFDSWSANASEYLWIHGIPGAGKTIICSTIIERMKEKCQEDPSIPVIYYYFDFADARKQSLDSFIQSAIYQILSTSAGEFPESATQLYDKYNGLQDPGTEELLEVFTKVLSDYPKIYIIADALDECSQVEREKFFRAFLKNIKSTKANLLMTSRREPDIEKAFKNIFHHIVCVEDSDVDTDVRTHVTTTMGSDASFSNWTPALKKEVLDAIVKGSRGMFRWAACQLETMKTCFTPRMIRAELNKMPENLDQIYDRILQSVPVRHQIFVQSALRWLAFANRPLLLNELAEAAVIDPNLEIFDPECRFLDPEKILELCSSLVTTSTKEYHGKLAGTDDWLYLKFRNEASRGFPGSDLLGQKFTTIALSHYSVKEYLSSDRLRGMPLIAQFGSTTRPNDILTECSLLYILNMGDGKILPRRVFDEYPLLEYCAVNWMHHYRKALSEAGIEGPSANKLLCRLFDDLETGPYVNWLNSYDPDDDAPGNKDGQQMWRKYLRKSAEQFTDPLYWAAQLDSIPVAQSLIEKGANVNGSGGGYFGSPLGAAAFYGLEKMVGLLLQNGADVEGAGGNFGYVLQAAAAGGSYNVVKMLVEAGADVDRTGGTWNTALMAATSHGHNAIVSFLLKSDADLKVSSASHGTTLYQAALAGDPKIVSSLLLAGADINEVGPEGTALYAAALSGSLPLVQTLIRRGADVNRGGRGEWGYPLTAAAQEGHVNIVRALLRAGANVNAQTDGSGGRGVSPLEAAIESRDLTTFQAIFEAGGNPNARGHLYPNPLFAALWTGETEMAKILLENNAEIVDGTFLEAISRWKQDPWFLRTILDREPNIDAHLGDKGSALHIAIKDAGEEVVELLLSKDPYVGAVSENGTVLSFAIDKGMTKIAKELIQRGADVHREGPNDSCPLTESILFESWEQTGSFEMTDILLQLGVDINCAGGRAISHAVNAGNTSVLQYLAKHGADLNTVIRFDECTPLQLAAMKGKLDIIETLLESGANLNGAAGRFGTTLHYALMSRKEPVVRYLLENGAKVDDSPPDCSLLCRALSARLTGLIPDLIKLGADVNKKDLYGSTPLASAMIEGTEEDVQLLLSHGAHTMNVGPEQSSSVVRKGNIEGIQRLFEAGADPNMCDATSSPMNTAVETGRQDLVDTLAELGASVSQLPGMYQSPLVIAAEAGDYQMAEHLLKLGADPNDCGTERRSALISAARTGNVRLVNLLLEHGADIMLHDGYVFRTAIWGGESMVLHLLDNVSGSPLNREKCLDSALQKAANNAKLNICRLLVDQGANLNFVGGEYGGPMRALFSSLYHDSNQAMNNRKIIFDLFREKGAKPDESDNFPSALWYAIRARKVDFAKQLLKDGADPNGRGDDEFYSPLQAATRFLPSMMEILIEAGADVNAVGGRFGTALHVAAYTHDCERIEVLLKHSARLDLQSPKYGNVIQVAAKCNTVSSGDWVAGEASVRTMQLLYSRGASVNTPGGRYGNALQLAAKSDNFEGLKWLLEHGADPKAKGRWGTALDAALVKKKWRIISYLEQHYGRDMSGA